MKFRNQQTVLKGKRTAYSRFTFAEFVNEVKSNERPEHNAHRDSGTQINEYRDEFTQTHTIDEAYELCQKGWEQGIEAMDTTELTAGTGTKPVFNRFRGRLNAVKYFTGSTQPFLRYEATSKLNLPRITVILPLSYSAGIDGEDALRYAQQLSKLVAILDVNYDINLFGAVYGEKAFNTNTGNQLTLIEIKKSGENVALNNMACALHPAFFRRLYFHYLEQDPRKLQGGYGRIRSTNTIVNELRKAPEFAARNILTTPALDEISIPYEDSKLYSNMIRGLKIQTADEVTDARELLTQVRTAAETTQLIQR